MVVRLLSGGYSTRRRLNEGMGPLEQHVACTAHQILNCTRGVNKSWLPRPYSQCENERTAGKVLTNRGFQDHTRNARLRELHERCYQIMVSRTILAMQDRENCTHGFQDHTRNERMRELHKSC